MLTRKAQYGWMVVGGLLCMSGGVVALKLREGNPALAQVEPPPALPTAAGPDAPTPPPAVLDSGDAKKAEPTPVAPAPVLSEGPPPLGPPPSVDPPSLPPVAVEPPGDPRPLPPAPPSVVAIEPAPPSPIAPPAPPIHDVPVDPPAKPMLPPAVAVSAGPGPFPPPQPDPMKVLPPAAVIQVAQVGEPPLAGTGPIQSYQVRTNGETMREIARHTLGTGERCTEVYKLNPNLHPEDGLASGTVVHLPPDACLPVEEIEGLKPLPAMRPKTATAKPKTVMALTGTYPCNLDGQRALTLPRAVRDQFGDADVVLASPGPDQCLWLTDQAHQERLAERLEHSPAREIDVRVFKRLYFAQTERVVVGTEGRIVLSDRLSQFAGLSQEVVLVGIDDHFEVWDAARWKQYTQIKSAAAASGSE